MPLTVNSKQAGDDLELELAGALEDKQKMPAIKARLAHRIVIDFDRVERISSEGVHLLGLWFKSFSPKQQFVFRRVPPRVIDIFDTVEELLPPERVFESFYVPYACQNCDRVENYLAARGKDFVEGSHDRASKLRLPETINCSACKQLMKIEVFESKYFRFLGIV